jgi:hypothetical protein
MDSGKRRRPAPHQDTLRSLDLSRLSQIDRDNWVVPLPKTDDPLMEWKCEELKLLPFMARARRVLAVPATLYLFSTAGNEMTKNGTRLKCDNSETLVFLHDVRP